ncbi:hypothetical protein [Streptomyces purpurascens]
MASRVRGQQGSRVRVLRVLQYGGRLSLLDDLAAAHHRHPVREPLVRPPGRG